MVYEYICEDCGRKEDVILGMNDEHPKRIECPNPQCNPLSMHRNYGQSTIYVPLAFKDNTYDFEKRAKRKYHAFRDKH